VSDQGRENPNDAQPPVDVVEREREEQLQRVRDWLKLPMAILSLVWVAAVVVEMAELVPAGWMPGVLPIDTAIWMFFLAEFLLELALAPVGQRTCARTGT